MAHTHSDAETVYTEKQQQHKNEDPHAHMQVHAHDAYAQANREYYDKHANSYKQIPLVEEAASRISSAFLAAATPPFSKAGTSVLDFACGPGLISRALLPHARRVVGVDISGGMVDAYNAAMRKDGFTPDEAHAVRLELTGRENELNGELFDVVVCSMAYHHLDSIEKITRILVSHLRPGGILLIADRIKSESDPTSDQHHHHDHHDHHQHQAGSADGLMKYVHDPEDLKHAVKNLSGFSENEITSTFASAGLAQVSYDPCVHVENAEIAYHIFIAKGLKPVV